jgi:transcriptional regulator with XRE-family HTH domain
VSKRTTVKVDIERIEIIIKANGWRNSYFAEVIMKKQRGWVSEWKRGKNFPSPEEAARMCILLKTTPDEILLHEGETPEETEKCLKDIETVRKLVEAEGIKEAPDPKTEGEGLSAAKKALLVAIDDLSDAQCEKLLPIVLSAKQVL